MTQVRIDDLSPEERRHLQRQLIQSGFLAPFRADGQPSDDGIIGPHTIGAYEAYWRSRQGVEIGVPVVTPAPAEPWWVSGTHWSLIAAVLSGLLSVAGYAVDSSELTQILATLAGLIAAVTGMIRNARRQNPIDQTLMARIGGRDIRLPTRVHRDRLSARPGQP